MCKVYIGSFNADVPVRTDLNPHGAELFAHEQADLLQDLYEIPQRSCDRKARPLSLRTGSRTVVREVKGVCLSLPHGGMIRDRACIMYQSAAASASCAVHALWIAQL